MKLEGIQAMVDMFELDKRTGVDLPHEVISTEHVNHRLNAFQLHLQAQMIEVAVARFLDSDMNIRRAMITAPCSA